MSNSMTKTVLIEEFGNSSVMKIVDIEVGTPSAGELIVRHKAVGLNFIDIYQRTGLYPLELPLTLGMEASGVVEAVGAGVTHVKIGDRVAYASNPPGAYSECRVMPAAQVCPLPDDISFEEGAAMMLKGLTVQYLFHRTVPIAKGDTVLFHAAAGGVGLIACQWARSEGINLIATAGSDEKCQMALDHGAAYAINYSTEDFKEKVKDITAGQGVPVVMDSVGKDTFDGSLDSLSPFGTMITFGNASGKVPPIDVGILAAKGSIKLTRPTLFTHIGDHARCQSMAKHLFDKVTSGQIKIIIDQHFKLRDVSKAHDALEARNTTGATVLEI
ncbi:MAG: NADPH2:quinone reductase [Paracoccaceae bacterium]|jgi:NADPH2:quinone reductase